MVFQMPPKSRFLRVPVEPFRIEAGLGADEVLKRMERISFQGRSLATARNIWQKMLADDCTIFLGLAGALSAGGMRLIIAHLLEHRYVDCLVSTGANLYHDLHEARGRRHFVGSPHESDAALQAERIDRVYDTYASEQEFCENDDWIADFVLTLERRPYTTREFLYKLGEHLWTTTGQDGILTAAYRANVPIFCPAIADSSIGMGLSQARHRDPSAGQIDVIGDIIESANLVIRRPRTASVVLGGGTPKNFINQASVQAEFYDDRVGGHGATRDARQDEAPAGDVHDARLQHAEVGSDRQLAGAWRGRPRRVVGAATDVDEDGNGSRGCQPEGTGGVEHRRACSLEWNETQTPERLSVPPGTGAASTLHHSPWSRKNAALRRDGAFTQGRRMVSRRATFGEESWQGFRRIHSPCGPCRRNGNGRRIVMIRRPWHVHPDRYGRQLGWRSWISKLPRRPSLPARASLKKLVAVVSRRIFEITTPPVVASSVTAISVPSGDQSQPACAGAKFM